ncbi:unnamed protein product, partial [Didymodactylos carnosus]
EAIVPRTIAKLAVNLSSNVRIYNLYGPAECTIASTYHMVNEKDLNASLIPIGYPLPNYQCYILDQYLQPVKISYLSNELTAEALVHLPNINAKCYKTGDLGKYDANGEIVYCGRTDFQVKLRGQRIELGEIENVIVKSSSSQISNCVVNKVHDDKTKQDYLIAYIQMAANNAMNEGDKLKSQAKLYCQTHLPLYMVPTMFTILDKFPLNSNGKIDRKLLPKLDFTAANMNDDMTITEPKTDVEREICNLWCKILCLDKISMQQNFFASGGTSLSIIQLFHCYQANFTLNKHLSISDIFQHPTVEEHVQLINNNLKQQKPERYHKPWETHKIITGTDTINHATVTSSSAYNPSLLESVTTNLQQFALTVSASY